MKKLRVLDLFSGLGGFSLGLERAKHEGGPYVGFETVAFCEIEAFPRRVLARHWPDVPCYDDVRTLTAERLAADGIAVDVITGGFPCQDISVAGKRAGLDGGTRSGLWSEIVRLAYDLRPQFIIVENVANLLSGPSQKRGGWFGRVLGDLAECGYDAEWENIPAAAVGAWHRRERVWIVCYPNQDGLASELGGKGRVDWSILETAKRLQEANQFNGPGADVSYAASVRQSQPGAYGQPVDPEASGDWQTAKPFDGCLGRIWRIEPRVDRVAHGVPDAVDRLAALGNAVVPQIPELIGNAILAAMACEKEAA